MIETIKGHLDLFKAAIAVILTAILFLWRNQKMHEKHKTDIAAVHKRLDDLNQKVAEEQEKSERSRAGMDRKLDGIGEGIHQLALASTRQQTFLETLHGSKIG